MILMISCAYDYDYDDTASSTLSPIAETALGQLKDIVGSFFQLSASSSHDS